MEQNPIYCTFCGTANALQAMNCSHCGQELIQPHPVQLEGGRIYMLRCTRCGAPIPVLTKSGGVACNQCGLYHNILAGQGYFTLSAALTGQPSQSEVDLVNSFFNSETTSILQTNPAFPPLSVNTQKVEKQARLSELQKQLIKKEKGIKQRQKNRLLSIIYLIIGPIAFFICSFYGYQHPEMNTTTLGLILLTFSFFFIIGILGVIINNRKRTARLQVDLEPLYTEVDRLKKELQQEQ